MSPLQWATPTGGVEMQRTLHIPLLPWRVPRDCPEDLVTLTQPRSLSHAGDCMV